MKLLIIVGLCLLAAGCGKLKGKDGSNGMNGLDGAQGVQGEQGVAGQDGSSCSVAKVGPNIQITCTDGTVAVINTRECL